MRKRWYNRGRWQLELERQQLPGYAPPPPADEAGVKDVVSGLLRRLGMDEGLWLRELESAWAPVVGAAVAAHTRPGRYQNGQLTVFVDSSAWLSELARYGQKEMLANVQKRFGAAKIRAIRLQMDPDGPAGRSSR